MKKMLVGLVLLFILSIILTSCKEPTNEEVFDNLLQKLDKVNSYTCRVEIKIQGNKGSEKYTAEYIYLKPNKFYMKYVKPNESRDFTTIFNGEQLLLNHPNIKESYLFNDYKNGLTSHVFLGEFLSLVKMCKISDVTTKTINENEYFLIRVDQPNNLRYRTTVSLLINKKSYVPYNLTIFDNDGKNSIEILYENFKYNEKFDNSIFNVKL